MRLASACLLVLLLVLLLALPAAAQAATPPAMAEPPTDVIVRYAPDATAGERADARAGADVRAEGALPGPQLELVDPEAGVSVAEAVEALEDDPAVLYAEPDVRRTALTTVPDDEFFGAQWALRNLGQTVNDTGGTVNADIAAVDGWDVTTGSAAVSVAVVDSGADLTHPDLAPNLVPGYDFVEEDAIPQDENGHGTHVAGTAGARGNDAGGVAGVAWRTGLMPLRVLAADGSGTVSDAIRAYAFAAAAGVRVVNLSLGGDTSSRAERDALAAAPQVLFVAAAGNEGRDLDVAGSYPCEYDLANVVCVAASDRDDQLASFSNFGAASVDLAAPGTDIASTYLDGTYAILDGTSMATPHVSGVAALLLSAEPTLTVAELRSALLGSAEPRPGLAGDVVTGGRLDLPRALASIGSTPPPPTRDDGDDGGSSGGGGGGSDDGDSAPAPAPTPAPAPPATPIGPQAAPALADRSAPILRLTVASRRDLARLARTGLTVTVRCSEACALRLRLAFASTTEARRAGLTRVLATRTTRRSAAGTVRLTLRLSARERSRLRGRRAVRLVLTTTATDPAGNRRVDVERLSPRRG